jgi:hypothetical protein
MTEKSGRRCAPPRRVRATSLEIQKWVARQHGFVAETAWIEHCRQLFGLATVATGVHDGLLNPCPPQYRPAIRQAFTQFGMLPK